MSIPIIGISAWLDLQVDPVRRAIVDWAMDAIGQCEENGDNRSAFIDALTLDAGSPLGSPWCAIFACGAWKSAGQKPLGDGACEHWHVQAHLQNRLVDKSGVGVGDIALFDFGTQKGFADHCGVVCRMLGNSFWTTEGNSTSMAGSRVGDGVYYHRWSFDSPSLVGFASLGL